MLERVTKMEFFQKLRLSFHFSCFKRMTELIVSS
nr:MAG TPA: hypothetical protein [Caudoviricetes sp.]